MSPPPSLSGLSSLASGATGAYLAGSALRDAAGAAAGAAGGRLAGAVAAATGQPTPDVAYRLSLGGRPVGADVIGAVQSVEVEDHAGLASMARVTLHGYPERGDAVWSLLEQGAFGRLAALRVEAQVGSRPFETLLDGYVVDVGVRFSMDASPSVVEVAAMDPSVLLALEEKVKAWPDLSDADIARRIFAAHGLAADVQATQPVRAQAERTTMQHGTDLQFLRHLAARNGYACHVEADPTTGRATGHFHPPDLQAAPQGTLAVALGQSSSVTALRARHDLLRPASASARGVQAGTLSVQQGASERGAWRRLGRTGLEAASRPRRLLLPGSGLSEAAELRTLAQAAVDQSLWAVELEGEADPSLYGGVLRAKRTVRVQGIGERLSGTYHVERALHAFGPRGYRVAFTLRRNAVGAT